MFRKIDESFGNILGFKLSGDFTESELKEMSKEIELTAADVGKINLIFELKELNEAPAVLDIVKDHRFATRFDKTFGGMVCIAEDKWKHWWEKFTATFPTTEAKFFTPEKRLEALDWIRD